ncbi:site-specific DNA-methyltransferase [Arachnia propionica]|nr:site-specific DNA-methyltransferase [Arachnia propionica]AFN46230.1 DNA (cytosine-5-)-methyltransferase [Arachnia propionica F0230a]QCT39063.1 site-specific DNA-methyltransferase [Arachnia propionica]RPA18158.1 site-specific DNA-methyltransferase [Arachnia propionica]
MERLRMTSPDFTQANIDKIAELFPTVMTESRDAEGNPERAVDFDLLRQELSGHIVEGPQERYRLDWPGKRAAAFAANAPIAKTLRPVREESVNFDTTKNLFIEGDNLDALKLLQESYLGKVKLIYIDPPYNTGNDFVYKDDFAETSADYLARSGQRSETGDRLVANTEANGRFHSDWLSMMYPRLKLARNLLDESGIIAISIDDNEVSNLRLACDEVFGRQNFVAQFVWTTKNAARGVPPKTLLMSNHEYIVVYARTVDSVRFQGLDRDEADFSNPDGDPRGLWRSESMKATGAQDNFFTISDPRTGNEFHANWAFSRSRIAKMIADGLVLFPDSPEGMPRQKKFIDSYVNDRKAFVTSLGWYSTENATKSLMALFEGEKVFDFPKPLELLTFLIRQATSVHNEDLVMDLFAGSGSSAAATMKLNAEDGGDRRSVMVQLPEPIPARGAAGRIGIRNIADLSRERIRRMALGIGDRTGLVSVGLDLGFRSLRVDSSNRADVLKTADDTEQLGLDDLASSVKPDRSGEDLLFQVLLDWGLELSLPMTREHIDGREVLSVDADALVACFAESVTPEVVRGIAERGPLRAVFRDDAFDSDAARINAEQVFREVSPATEVRTI